MFRRQSSKYKIARVEDNNSKNNVFHVEFGRKIFTLS